MLAFLSSSSIHFHHITKVRQNNKHLLKKKPLTVWNTPTPLQTAGPDSPRREGHLGGGVRAVDVGAEHAAECGGRHHTARPQTARPPRRRLRGVGEQEAEKDAF